MGKISKRELEKLYFHKLLDICKNGPESPYKIESIPPDSTAIIEVFKLCKANYSTIKNEYFKSLVYHWYFNGDLIYV